MKNGSNVFPATDVDLPLPPSTFAGLVAAIVTIALIALATYQTLDSRTVAVERVTQTLTYLQQLESVGSTLKDAETAQRGFLLSGEERYVEPYTAANGSLPGMLSTLRAQASDDAARTSVDTLTTLIDQKLEELGETIRLKRAGDNSAALQIVRTDRGKAMMDNIRALIAQMEGNARLALTARQAEFQRAVTLSSWSVFGGLGALTLLLSLAALVMSRDFRARETETWLRTGQMGLNLRMQGEQRLEVLGDNVLSFLSSYLNAQVGALFVVDRDGGIRRVASYAMPQQSGTERLLPGEGLLGQVVKDNRPLHVTAVPEGYLAIGSSVGRAKPTELLLAPGSVDNTVHGVVELGFFHRLQPRDLELLSRTSEAFGVAVRASKDRSRLEELLEETQSQAEELQTQQEELRVNNEELEEQSRVLRESQARLETQQTELEQINAQLEEQTQILEAQKQDLGDARNALIDRAAELERANRYKSEFLANMSHELRTPLNSSLILAKLLEDNKTGNLTDEQVRFAQTIGSAGNDLLALINDILDLSKIEAGRVELALETVSVSRTTDTLVRSLRPLAEQKGLSFETLIEPGTPDSLETDPQRLGQVLKNLLSNAIKFTEHGGVGLRVFSPAPGRVAFAVRDTGIGIPADQQSVVFEAFRQADGSTHRKYGGTGLGLSISRDLARLLGGDLSVQSGQGEGSVFTLTLPLTPPSPAEVPAAAVERQPVTAPAAARAAASTAPSMPGLRPPAIDDDRERLSPDSRRVLIVDDDVHFAAVLGDLAHEMRFQYIAVHAANDVLPAAARYAPHAILLDVNLPDYSGLGVLDQLKRNPETRHIPVHMISVADHQHQALERGAIGYAMKPVRREELVDAFKKLEARLTQRLRQVLIVEDDERQRESIAQLLGSEDVQITAVGTAGEALQRLRTTTFDCMVMDLKLPDFSGYELLEKMAGHDDVSFPPVIVYTGRTLTRDEEQRLQRFSRSIIIKDARSPERLLDEVTLFLHQVEATLPAERQRMLRAARDRDAALDGRRILVVEDDARNIFALSSVLEPKGAKIEIARNGREALEVLGRNGAGNGRGGIDLVLMDIMMPEMDGLTAMREIRKRPEWKKLPIVALTAKAMKDDQERCLAAGANDYIAKPLDVEKLLSLVRVWMPK